MATTRDAFARKLYSTNQRGRRWANYDDLNALEHAPRLLALRMEYLAGHLGDRSGQRSAAWREVLELSKAGFEVLELFTAIFKVGLAGTIAEQSEIARHVERLIAPCKIRKVRYGLRELVDHGWIVANPLPTGRHKERSNGRWTTCQVIQYTIAPKALSLLSSRSSDAIASGRVDPSSLLARSSDSSSDKSITDTVAKNPLQRVPTTAREERTPLQGVQLRPVVTDKNEPLELSEDLASNEEGSTRPDAIASDLRTSSREPRANGARDRLEGGSRFRMGGKLPRRGSPRTWQNGRRALLEDLASITAGLRYLSGFERAAILAAAASQTASTYRLELGTALEWAPLVLRWLDLPRAERIDEITARIVPLIRASLAPDALERDHLGRATDERDRRASDGRRELLDSCARPRCAVDLEELEELRGRLYLARAAARCVAAGRCRWEDLGEDTRHLVTRCGEVFGPLVGQPLAPGGVRSTLDDPAVH
jgi:hypothetical protein